MENISFTIMILIFIISAILIWFAGVTLAKTTDTLDTRYKLGQALGGLILLGITGSLPEIAVIYSAALDGHTPVIIGNLIGGISIQVLLLVVFDFATKKKRPLSYMAGSLILSFETLLAMIILAIAILGTFISPEKNIFHLNPVSPLILIAWIVGLFLINKARKVPRYYKVASDADPGRKHHEKRAVENHPFYANRSTLHVILIFLFASIITLIAGVLLERTGTSMANHFGIGTGLFAATVLAFVTSLPEISTGLESIFIGDNQLAISDIMGGNAFMLTIFFLADIVAKKPVLSYAGNSDRLLAYLGLFMMAVFVFSFAGKLRRRYFRLGLDSIFEIFLYAGGIYLLTKL